MSQQAPGHNANPHCLLSQSANIVLSATIHVVDSTAHLKIVYERPIEVPPHVIAIIDQLLNLQAAMLTLSKMLQPSQSELLTIPE